MKLNFMHKFIKWYVIPLFLLWMKPSTGSSQAKISRDNFAIQIQSDFQQKVRLEVFDSLKGKCYEQEISAEEAKFTFNKVSPTQKFEFRFIDPVTNRVLQKESSVLPRKVFAKKKRNESQIIYQLPVRTFLATGLGSSETGKFENIGIDLVNYLKNLKVDYVWLTGVLENSNSRNSDASVVKGEAGSYYAIYDVWDVNSDQGSLKSLIRAVDLLHEAGLGVLIDLVPNHTARSHRTDFFCKQKYNFGEEDRKDRFFDPNNSYYYLQNTKFHPPLYSNSAEYDANIFESGIQEESPAKATGNDIFEPRPQASDWFETIKLNYGFNYSSGELEFENIPKTWITVVDAAKHWMMLGVDGFRVDFVHSVPIEFWKHFAKEVRALDPNVFLLAEAYESDSRMKLPGFSYEALLGAGFDSIYNSSLYWSLRNQALGNQQMQNVNWFKSPAARESILEKSFLLTHYLENHDELRVASDHFSPQLTRSIERGLLGFSYSMFLAMLPGNFLIHGGQEFLESASIWGQYAGNNGKTSIFDYVFPAQVLRYFRDQASEEQQMIHRLYSLLVRFKKQSPFNKTHSKASKSIIDLSMANSWKKQSNAVGSYLRFDEKKCFLVVLNSDPHLAHETTIHFTDRDGIDSLEFLKNCDPDSKKESFVFEEKLIRNGWRPSDPNSSLPQGSTREMVLKSGGIPSGLYLGNIPPRTIYIFELL